MTLIQFLGEWVVRSSILILAGALTMWLLRVKNPAVRLAALTAMLAGSLAIPLLSAALPKLPLLIMSAPSPPSPVRAAAPARDSAGIHPWNTTLGTISASAPPRAVSAQPFDPMRVGAILYALVTVALLLRLFGGLALSRRILRQSRPCGIPVKGIMSTAIAIRESDFVASPVTIGIVDPAILLPPDWREWQPAKLDAVLAHEQSHIRRRDPALQFVSAIHRALLWASPFSWLLDRCIVRTAEEISDDAAIAATSDRVSYAEVLLEFVQRGAGQPKSLGVAMARYQRPEKRIRRILNSTGIPSQVTRWSILAILGLGAPLAYLVAASRPQSAPNAGPSQTAASQPIPAAKPDPKPAAARPADPQSVTSQGQPSAPVAFEVASIKPTEPGVPHQMGVHVYRGGRVVVSSFALKTLIQAAFGLSYWQISGGEEWTAKDEYNVEAKPAEGSAIKDLRYTLFGIEDEHLREMLQALLIDRFQLKFHKETKTGDVYRLEKSGKAVRLRPAEVRSSGADPSADPMSFGSIGYANGKWSIFATSMPQLARFASSMILHVPVLDRTGLTGLFDYRERQPDLEPNYGEDQSRSFKSYLAELGLKLEPAKGPVEIFVIDHAAKPLPN